MPNPISALTTTPGSARTSETASPTMDRDGFLKLLVAQLSNQDPLQPAEGMEFVTQLSQFALVEQSLSQSNQLGVISTQMRGLSHNEAAGLVGQSVTVRGRSVAFDGAAATTSNVTLGAAAARVSVSFRDANGRVVRTMELGAHQAGPLAVRWDGRDDQGQSVARGSYSVAVTATTEDERAVTVTHDVSGTVTRVSYDQGYPQLTLDSGASAPISDLVSVGGSAPRTP